MGGRTRVAGLILDHVAVGEDEEQLRELTRELVGCSPVRNLEITDMT